MIPFAKATSHDVFELLSTIHQQLDVFDKKTLKWRDKIDGQLGRMEDALQRIEFAISRRR